MSSLKAKENYSMEKEIRQEVLLWVGVVTAKEVMRQNFLD
jgi:hypothetical protein